MRLRGIPVILDQRMVGEDLVNHRALDALAAAVNQPHLAQPGLVGRVDVFIDHGWDVARGERMQIERAFDWNLVSH